MKNNIIRVLENKRPFWQLILAALFFTIATAIFIFYIYKMEWSDNNIRAIGWNIESIIILIGIGVGFSFQKSVYIDLKNSKFRSTFEIGPIKFGQWKRIEKYDYVSVFHQPLADGNKIFEVNLWYNKNKHWQLYEKYDYEEAFLIGYKVSELLNISLLDATIPNDYKWIDKKILKEKGEIKYLI